MEGRLSAAIGTPFNHAGVIFGVPAATLADDSDDQFVLRTVSGDPTAFVTLVDRYKRAAYSLAYRLLGNAADAEDAAQETFVRAYTRLSSYQIGSRFGSWLLSITSHWCIDFLRRRRAVSLEELEVRPIADETSDHPESLALQSERRDEVQRWLVGLPAPYRSVLILRYWQDLSYIEISQTTGLPVSTIRMRLFRARQLLAKQRVGERTMVNL